MCRDEIHLLLVYVVVFLLPITICTIPVPTILDTDIGTAYDDQVALTYILSRRDLFHLKLIVCSTSNTTVRALIVAKTLRIFKRFDIPIALGPDTKDNGSIYQSTWTQDYSLEMFQKEGGTVFIDGTQSLIDEMSKASVNNIYHYIQIGPATSLGYALRRQPSLAMYMRLFAMAGSLYRGYGNSNTSSKEWNVEVDIPSAQIMFTSRWTYFGLAPLDCTSFMQFNNLVWQTFLSYTNISSTAKMIIDSYTIWYNNGGKDQGATLAYSPQLGTPEMHDVLAVYLAGCYPSISPTVSASLPLYVTEDGFTRENQSINTTVYSCIRYETIDPYTATAQIGSVILESIAKQGLVSTGTVNHFVTDLLLFAFVFISC